MSPPSASGEQGAADAERGNTAEPSWPLTTWQGWQRFATTDPPAPPRPSPTTRPGPAVIVTDKLRSYGGAHRQVMPAVEHRSHQGLNNQAESSHQPTRATRARGERLPIGGCRTTVPGRVQRHLTPLPTPPPPDDRPELPHRDDHPLRDLGPDHRRCQPAHHGLNAGPGRGPTTPRHTIRQSHTQQRHNALQGCAAAARSFLCCWFAMEAGTGTSSSESWFMR